MAPIPEPGPGQDICPHCRLPLPKLRPLYCPHCGASIRGRPLWLSIIAALGAGLLGLAALGLGAIGACFALFTLGGSNDSLLVTVGFVVGAALCGLAAIAILVWLLKKPK